uniref:tRNA-intron lyase n=1 Tax=Parastrongyloides trichosuri TaxID=131310 RepID=A0A0N4ZYI8_PARTI
MSNIKKKGGNQAFKKWKFKPSMLINGYLRGNGVAIEDKEGILHLIYNGSYGKFLGHRMNFQNKDCFLNEDKTIDNKSYQYFTHFVVNNSTFLILSYVEAFYLAYYMKILNLYIDKQKKITINEFWEICISSDKRFIKKFCVYKFFREKCWVVSSGISFGCDYVLYKRSPEVVHASAGVYIHDKSSYEETDFTTQSSFGLQRVLSNVKKDLIYCYLEIDEEKFDPYKIDSINLIKVSMKGKKARKKNSN